MISLTTKGRIGYTSATTWRAIATSELTDSAACLSLMLLLGTLTTGAHCIKHPRLTNLNIIIANRNTSCQAHPYHNSEVLGFGICNRYRLILFNTDADIHALTDAAFICMGPDAESSRCRYTLLSKPFACQTQIRSGAAFLGKRPPHWLQASSLRPLPHVTLQLPAS